MIDFRLLGVLLRQARESLGLSLDKVEEVTKGEFKKAIVGQYERGATIISLARLEKLANLYGHNYYSILTRLETNREIRDITDLPPEIKKLIDQSIKVGRQQTQEEIEQKAEPPPKKQEGGQKP